MMLFAAVLIIISLAGFVFYREYFVKGKLRKQAELKYRIFEPVIQKLMLKEPITDVEILLLVIEPSTRHTMFRILEEYGRKDLFPAEFLNQEKGAESFLVSWLEFPTELGDPPDEIKLIAKFALKENDIALNYYSFKFRTFPPHRSSHNNWMIGIAGPYTKDSHPYDIPKRVYSRFREIDKASVEDEVRWVHQNIGQ